MASVDRTADLFHDLLIKPELERERRAEASLFYCPFGYGECVDANGCCYPGRCSRGISPPSHTDMGFRSPRSLPYQRESATSRTAAVLALPKAGTQRRRVYDFLVGCGPRGATDDEMQARLPMNPSTQRPRRVELVKAGLIAQARTQPPLVGSGTYGLVTRKTASGRDAVVWVAV